MSEDSHIASTKCKDCQDDNGVCLGDALCGCPHHDLQTTNTKCNHEITRWNSKRDRWYCKDCKEEFTKEEIEN